MNGKLGRMREVVEMQKIRIDYLVDMNMENDTDTPEDQQERRNKIKDLKESNAKFEIDIKDTTAKLINEGKYEYEEIQKHLANRQEYIDDISRRKSGSKKWYEDQGQIMAYDRAIDEYRTGKLQGHFAGADMDEYRAKVKAEDDKIKSTYKKERDEKNKVKHDKMRVENDEAFTRMKSKGFELDENGKFADWTPDMEAKYELPNERPTNAKDHKSYLKQYKSALESKSDILTLRTNLDEINQGYSSPYEKRDLRNAKFKVDNFVEDHSMTGVVMYNGGDKKMAGIYEKQFNTIPKVGQNEIKEISIHSSGEPTGSRVSKRGGVIVGSWDNKGKISMFHASGASRRKLEKLGITKDDFDLTGDHEFAHATWHGVKEDIKKTGQSTLSEAMDKFNASVVDAYDDKNFKLDSYTDTYRKGGSAGRMGREKDILENEVHSKLREYEKSGVLEEMENTANTMMGFQADYDKGGDIKARIEDKYGDMVSVGMVYGMTPTKAKFMQNMIKSYKSLRQEMYEI